MKILAIAGAERVSDLVGSQMQSGCGLGAVTPALSLFAYAELMAELTRLRKILVLLPQERMDLAILGSEADRASRNRLRTRWLARRFFNWLGEKAEALRAIGVVPQAALVLRNRKGSLKEAMLGSFAFSAEGLSTTPGNPLRLIRVSEAPGKASCSVNSSMCNGLLCGPCLIAHQGPASVYLLVLHQLFADQNANLGEDLIFSTAARIRNMRTWKKPCKLQRDGVVGAIDKLDRYCGCSMADGIGLGKSFETVAAISYHKCATTNMLVFCPKRKREKWTLAANVLVAGRFNCDVPNHTDLSRVKAES